MTDNIKDKLSKIYKLVNRGSTAGERAAAKKALDRIITKYGIDEDMMDSIHLKSYRFKYSTQLEFDLIIRLADILCSVGTTSMLWDTNGVREIMIELTYLDWVKLEAAYEYFRRHMKLQWNKTCAKELKRCRKVKTRNARRIVLQRKFFTHYIIASKLYKEGELREKDQIDSSELKDLALMSGIEGGQYNHQVTNGLLIE